MRGYQKRVIYLKNTGNKNFEEAYFVLRDADRKCASSASMIDEAKHIIEESFGKRRCGFFYTKKWYLISFLLGFSLSFLMWVIITLIF